MNNNEDFYNLIESNPDMWGKFFNSVEYSNSLKEGLTAYKNLSDDIDDLSDELYYDVAQENIAQRESIREDIRKIAKQITRCESTLNKISNFPEAQIVIEEIKNNLEKLKEDKKRAQGKYNQLKDYVKQGKEINVTLKEKTNTLSQWEEKLKILFEGPNGTKETMINQAKSELAKLTEQKNKYDLILKNIENNEAYYSKKVSEYKKNFGDFSKQAIEAEQKMYESREQYAKVLAEKKAFSVLNNKTAEILLSIEFLEKITFEDFLEKLSERKFDLTKMGTTTINSNNMQENKEEPTVSQNNEEDKIVNVAPSPSEVPKQKSSNWLKSVSISSKSIWAENYRRYYRLEDIVKIARNENGEIQKDGTPRLPQCWDPKFSEGITIEMLQKKINERNHDVFGKEIKFPYTAEECYEIIMEKSRNGYGYESTETEKEEKPQNTIVEVKTNENQKLKERFSSWKEKLSEKLKNIANIVKPGYATPEHERTSRDLEIIAAEENRRTR